MDGASSVDDLSPGTVFDLRPLAPAMRDQSAQGACTGFAGRGAVRGLTDNAVRTSYIDKLMKECRSRYTQGRAARLAAIAPVLKEDPVLVDAAFSLAAACAFADSDIGDEENELINELSEALGLSPDRSEELLNQLEEDSDED